MTKPPASGKSGETGNWVPLFPLPNVVLLPTAVLPLHIFEDRYRRMTADALASDRRIAMALLKPGWETQYHGLPAIEPVVCVGLITDFNRLPDGRYNLLLKGIQRCRVGEEDVSRPYRTGNLVPINEVETFEIDVEREREKLKSLLHHSSLAKTELARQCRRLCESSITTPQLADVLAFSLINDPAEKQALLTEPDQRQRVGRVTRVLNALYPVRSIESFDRHPPSLN